MQQIGSTVAAQSPRKDVSYRFAILGSDAPNALAAPGGYIFVTRGLLDTIDSNDELAAVLGHEVGHVAKKHAQQQIGANVAFLLLRGQVHDEGVRTGLSVFNILRTLSKSREMEAQADEVGLSLTQASGFDPNGLVAFFEGLGVRHPSRLEEYFMTHPAPEKRREKARRDPLNAAPTVEQRERRAEGFARRGLSGLAEAVRRGTDPLLLPPLPEAPPPPRLAQERASVVGQAEATRGALTGAWRARRVGVTLQQILLINNQGDLRWLWVATRAYQVQSYVDDVYARIMRTSLVTPGTYDALAALEEGTMAEANGALGREEIRRSMERMRGAPLPLRRAAVTVAAVIADLNNRFLRTNNETAWLRYASLEAALRYAESELARADRASGEAWRYLSVARIRRYEERLNSLLPEGATEKRALWADLGQRRFGVAFPTNGPAGGATVRAALAVQLGRSASEVEQGRGNIPWGEWVLRRKGIPENIATAMRLLTLDLERELAARERYGQTANRAETSSPP